jgi:hypothetical protein
MSYRTVGHSSPAVKQPPRDPKVAGSLCDFHRRPELEFSRRTGNLQNFGRRSRRIRFPAPIAAEASLMATLRTEGLTKTYGDRTVVRSVDLDVSSGEVVGLLGPNGAGKTTTFSMVVGLVGRTPAVCCSTIMTSRRSHVRAGPQGHRYLPQEASIFQRPDGGAEHPRYSGDIAVVGGGASQSPVGTAR